MPKPDQIDGSCFCGAIAYTCGPLTTGIGYCHCHTCQKTHAAPFAPTARTKRATFRWTRGGDALKHIESSPGKLRHFCGLCGTHLMAERLDLDEVILRVGSIDTPLDQKAVVHIWMSHEPDWHQTQDDLPKFPEGFPR